MRHKKKLFRNPILLGSLLVLALSFVVVGGSANATHTDPLSRHPDRCLTSTPNSDYNDTVFGGPPHHKFPYGFICGYEWGGIDGDRDQDKYIDYTVRLPIHSLNGTPGGRPEPEPHAIPAGSYIDVQTGYDGSGYAWGENVIVWSTIDMRDQIFAGGPALIPPSGGDNSYIAATGALCPGADQSDNPAWPWIPAFASHNDAGGGSPYRDQSPYYLSSPGSCGLDGKMIAWLRSDGGPTNFRQAFRMQTSNALPANAADGAFCIRTHVSLAPTLNTAHAAMNWFSAEAFSHVAKISTKRCWAVVPETIGGTIRGAEEETDERGLGGVAVYLDERCDGSIDKSTTSAGDGSYTFRSSVGQLACISTEQGPKNIGGTMFKAEQPVNEGWNCGAGPAWCINGGAGETSYTNQVIGVHCAEDLGGVTVSQVGDVYSPNYFQNCYRGASWPGRDLHDAPDDDSFDFYFEPIPEYSIPNISKSGSAGGGTVQPGQRIDYQLVISNPYNYNSYNAVFNDPVPLNMRQGLNDVVIDSVELRSMNPADFWQTQTVTGGTNLCDRPGAPGPDNAFMYGNPPREGSFECWYHEATNDVTTGTKHPAIVGVGFDRMPARSQFIMRWHGFVKGTKQQIGVYPAGSAMNYCSTTFEPNYSQTGIVEGCENLATGLQGVYNIAFGTVGNVTPAGTNKDSNPVYNPMPGRIDCIGKSANAEVNYEVTPTRTHCGITYEPEYLYSGVPAPCCYNEATFYFAIGPNNTPTYPGPAAYRIEDNLSDTPMNRPPNMGHFPTQNYSGGPPTVTWNHNSYTFAGGLGPRYPNYPLTDGWWFKSTFNNSMGNFTNRARVCTIHYWEPPGFSTPSGRREDCSVQSNGVFFRKVAITAPFLDSKKGSVHAGGGTPGGECTLSDPLKSGISNNPGGRGWYVVSSNAGTAPLPSAAGKNLTVPLGSVCRPDLEQSAKDFISRNPSKVGTGPGMIDHKVVGSGGYDLGATTINHRSTLFVEGDLYITGDIKYKPDGGLLKDAASFGVIVTGNIYVANNVRQLDGYYYSKGRINTCAVRDSNPQALGGVKTLSYKENVPYSTPSYGFSATECGYKATPSAADTLKVNGLLMAREFRYNRPVGNSTNAVPAELASFTDRLFTATPPAFSDLAFRINNLYGGERRPRF